MKKPIFAALACALITALPTPAFAGKSTTPFSGALDSSFNRSGIVTTDFARGTDDASGAALIPSDDSIIVAGTTTSNGFISTAATRLSNTGATQTTFGNRGSFVGLFCPSADSVLAPVTFSSTEALVPVYCPGTDAKLFLARFNSSGYVATLGGVKSFGATTILGVTTTFASGAGIGRTYILTQETTSSDINVYSIESDGTRFGLWGTYSVASLYNCPLPGGGANLAGIRMINSGQVVFGGTLYCPGEGNYPFVVKIDSNNPASTNIQIETGYAVTGIIPTMTTFQGTTYIAGVENFNNRKFFISRFDANVNTKTSVMTLPTTNVFVTVGETNGVRRVYLTYASPLNGVWTVYSQFFADSWITSVGFISAESTFGISGDVTLRSTFATETQGRVYSIGRTSVRGKSDFLVIGIFK